MGEGKFYDYSLIVIKKSLKRLEVPKELSKWIQLCAERCQDAEIHPSDLVLTKHMYLPVEREYGVPAWKTKKVLLGFLSELSKGQLADIKVIFDYKDKPTPKKFIQLILSNALF